MRPTHGELFADWEIAVAKRVVQQSLARNRWLKSEFEDLLQECYLHWWKVRETYDPDNGASRTTYMGKVLRRHLKNVADEQARDKRKVSHVAESLDAPAANDDGSATVGIDPPEMSAGRTESGILRLDLAIDLDAACRRLTVRQEKVLSLRGAGHSVTEIARQLEIHRDTVRVEVSRIRRLFLDCRLREYLT